MQKHHLFKLSIEIAGLQEFIYDSQLADNMRTE